MNIQIHKHSTTPKGDDSTSKNKNKNKNNNTSVYSILLSNVLSQQLNSLRQKQHYTQTQIKKGNVLDTYTGNRNKTKNNIEYNCDNLFSEDTKPLLSK
jgi:hypothetical protein